ADLAPPPRWNELDPQRPIVVVTAHRRENHEYMRDMCLAMADIAAGPEGAQIYWPVHPSPRVAPVAHEVLDGVPGVVLVEPIDYAQIVYAIRGCSFVLTDSGGIQEEAPCLGKPVLVMREETERPEGLQAGTLELVGHDRARILESARRLLNDRDHYAQMARSVNPYGDGHASERIVAWLLARRRQGTYPDPFDPATAQPAPV
ncbi:MAG TPA: UDP-N-acetylglucosamine 2-epimerase, partial [Candidatus Tumulicola sp.]